MIYRKKLLEGYGKNLCLKLCFKYFRMLFGNKRDFNLSLVMLLLVIYGKKIDMFKFFSVIFIYMVFCFFLWYFVLLEFFYFFLNIVLKINKY